MSLAQRSLAMKALRSHHLATTERLPVVAVIRSPSERSDTRRSKAVVSPAYA